MSFFGRIGQFVSSTSSKEKHMEPRHSESTHESPNARPQAKVLEQDWEIAGLKEELQWLRDANEQLQASNKAITVQTTPALEHSSPLTEELEQGTSKLRVLHEELKNTKANFWAAEQSLKSLQRDSSASRSQSELDVATRVLQYHARQLDEDFSEKCDAVFKELCQEPILG